jgi:hypothetical protein
VVAATMMIQNESVTSGTLFSIPIEPARRR